MQKIVRRKFKLEKNDVLKTYFVFTYQTSKVFTNDLEIYFF